ncbi:hypothetical protein [Chthoniobacter sp.]|uniref:hypothetical protein n=1 Tax=Chthoniobacter sp. TaxID=2510640 RepID=UPI0032B00CCE
MRGFVFDGDSHTYGNADPANAWPNFLHTQPRALPYILSNIATNGATWGSVSNRYAAFAYPLSPAGRGVPCGYWLHIGSNNIAIGDSGASIYAGAAAILARAKADGFDPIGVTQPWGDDNFTSDQNTQLLAYNALLVDDPSITPGLIFDGYTIITPFNSAPYHTGGDNHLNPTGQAFYASNVYPLLLGSNRF